MRRRGTGARLPRIAAALAFLLFAPAAGWTAEEAIAAGTSALPTLAGVTTPPAPRAVADFELTDHNGRPMRFSALHGKPALVFFGFTHCPDVCPGTLQKLGLLKRNAGEELREVPVVMISVDGDRDSPQTMKTWLAGYSPEFIGLTGDPRTVRDIAAQFPAVFFKGLPARAGESYTVEHSYQVYAIDRAGRVRAEIANAKLEDMATLMRALLAEPPP